MQFDPRSHGLWGWTACPSPPTQKLTSKVKADVAIVGGGYTGLSAALHLAESSADVVLLEAVDIGFGGAGRNVGLVNAGLWVTANDVIAVLGPLYGERLTELLGTAPALVFKLIERYGIDCEAERSGTLHCAVGRNGLEELKQRTDQLTERGAPVRLLNADETYSKVGTRAFTGSLLDLRAGTIQPLSYARGLARAAIAAGARLFTESPAISVGKENGRWNLRTPKGAVSAEWIVVATDAYSEGPWSEIREEQVHLPYFNFATEPLSDQERALILPERQGVWDTNTVLSSFRLDRSGRLVFGSVGALRGTGLAVHRAWAKRQLERLFPQIEPRRFVAEWYGKIGMTDDNMPRLHMMEDNVISISGYNGRGIAPGTTFGRVLAEYIQGRIHADDLPLPITIPKKARFRNVREAYYELGAQVAHLFAGRFG